ncbi:hypothetical protein C8R44DRAFT_914905 [Mycena epipterygia]|nr:hypothetical protein C8R44DRAFT_914905 [Mycena epipterygia]
MTSHSNVELVGGQRQKEISQTLLVEVDRRLSYCQKFLVCVGHLYGQDPDIEIFLSSWRATPRIFNVQLNLMASGWEDQIATTLGLSRVSHLRLFLPHSHHPLKFPPFSIRQASKTSYNGLQAFAAYTRYTELALYQINLKTGNALNTSLGRRAKQDLSGRLFKTPDRQAHQDRQALKGLKTQDSRPSSPQDLKTPRPQESQDPRLKTVKTSRASRLQESLAAQDITAQDLKTVNTSRASRIQEAGASPLKKSVGELLKTLKNLKALQTVKTLKTSRGPRRRPEDLSRTLLKTQDLQDLQDLVVAAVRRLKTSVGNYSRLETSRPSRLQEAPEDAQITSVGHCSRFKTSRSSRFSRPRDFKTGLRKRPEDHSGTLLKTQDFKALKTSRQGPENARKTSVGHCSRFKTSRSSRSSRPQDFKTGPQKRPEDHSGTLLKTQDFKTSRRAEGARTVVSGPSSFLPPSLSFLYSAGHPMFRVLFCTVASRSMYAVFRGHGDVECVETVCAEVFASHGEVDNGKRVDACRLISRGRVRASAPSSCSLAVGPGLSTVQEARPPLARDN